MENCIASTNKCISLIQPWASMVVQGVKTLETRSFPAAKAYTGGLFIHASKRIPGRVFEKYLREPDFRIWTNITANIRPDFVLTRSELDLIFPLGAIIGKVNLHECVRAEALRDTWANTGRGEDWFRECILGDLGPERFAWVLSRPVLFKSPIPAKGTISPILWDCTNYLNTAQNG